MKKMSKLQKKKKKAEFIKLVKENHGIIGATLEQVGLSRYYYDMWRREDQEFAEVVDGLPQQTLDFVESKLLQNIADGDKTSIIFYLKCKGKELGYIDKQVIEQTTTFATPVKLNIIIPQPKQIDGDNKKQIDNE